LNPLTARARRRYGSVVVVVAAAAAAAADTGAVTDVSFHARAEM